jgi:hypothetical protein
VNTYVHPEVPTGILVQPLWQPPQTHTDSTTAGIAKAPCGSPSGPTFIHLWGLCSAHLSLSFSTVSAHYCPLLARASRRQSLCCSHGGAACSCPFVICGPVSLQVGWRCAEGGRDSPNPEVADTPVWPHCPLSPSLCVLLHACHPPNHSYHTKPT